MRINRPSDHLATEPVKHYGEINPTMVGENHFPRMSKEWDIGNIRIPHLVRSTNPSGIPPRHQVSVAVASMIRVGGDNKLALGCTEQIKPSHGFQDCFAAFLYPLPAQHVPDTTISIAR